MLIDSKKLDLAMARKCIDKATLAEKAGVTYQSVKRSTVRKETRPETVGKIAKALGVDPFEIVKDE